MSQEPLRKGRFYLEGMETPIEGYTDNCTWNGWACPFFPKESVVKLIDWINKNFEGGQSVDAFDGKTIVILDKGQEGDPAEEWTGEEMETPDGKILLWDIGRRSWCWDELEKGEELPSNELETKKYTANIWVSLKAKSKDDVRDEIMKSLSKFEPSIEEIRENEIGICSGCHSSTYNHEMVNDLCKGCQKGTED